MKKLITGIVDFRKNITKEKRLLFKKLALGQKPDTLFIACSDSRVVPNLFASTNPGDLFVIRNIGNLIPPLPNSHGDSSAAAALEFSIFALKISDIIVCGHSECGAMLAILNGLEDSHYSSLKAWLRYGEKALTKLRSGVIINSELTPHNQLSQINVLQQMEHIKSYPFIKDRLSKNKLRIHGWWFDIAQADVYSYEPEISKFALIDEEYSKIIIERLT